LDITKNNNNKNKELAVKAIAAVIVLTGLAVIFGWIFDITLLKSISPAFVPMKFITAVSFIFGGIVLYLLTRKERWSKIALMFILPIVSVLLIMLVSDSVFGIGPDIVNLFVKEPAGAREMPSIPGTVSFALVILIGYLSVFGVNTKRFFVLLAAGCIIGIIGFIGVLGYILNLPALYYNIEGVSGAMPLQSAILFTLGGLGLVLLYSEEEEEAKNEAGLSFVAKFSLAIFAAVAIIGLITVYVLTSQSKGLITQDVNENTGRMIDYTAQLVGLYIGNPQVRLEQLALDSYAVSALKTGDNGSLENMKEKMTTLVKYGRVIKNIGLLDMNCVAKMLDEHGAASVGNSFSLRDYCTGVLKTKTAYVSGAWMSTIPPAAPVLGVSVPVNDYDGRMIGFITGSINVAALRDSLTKLQQNEGRGTNRYVVLLDKYGNEFLNTGKEITAITPPDENGSSGIVY